jgi:hypothetical protein
MSKTSRARVDEVFGAVQAWSFWATCSLKVMHLIGEVTGTPIS